MVQHRRLILVTGAPRTATTPVGNMLARCRGVVSLYEPLGPTGLASFAERYPILGPGLGLEPDSLDGLLKGLRDLRPGKLKTQRRPGAPSRLATRILGSRTLHSFRLARLRPWSRIVLWKDPHAIFLAPDLVARGADVDVVVTVRPPRAHAASYKRLGWRSKASEVYPRWALRFGRCELCERYLDQANDSVVSAALLWRLCYLPLIRSGAISSVCLITSEDLERNEAGAYHGLMERLKLDPGEAVDQALSNARRKPAGADLGKRVHDWTRSVSSVNSYWKQVLSPADLQIVDSLTSDIVQRFFSSDYQC